MQASKRNCNDCRARIGDFDVFTNQPVLLQQSYAIMKNKYGSTLWYKHAKLSSEIQECLWSLKYYL